MLQVDLLHHSILGRRARVQSDDHHVQANLPAAKTTIHTMRNRNIETAKLACFLNSLRPSLIRVVRRKNIERYEEENRDRGGYEGYDFENHCPFSVPCNSFIRSPRRRARAASAARKESTARHVITLCIFATRQAHRERRALARLARHRHVAAHHARELAGDGKAEARAAEALSGRGVGLAELLEQLSLLLRSHANAGVSDRELDPVATVGDPASPQPDLAFLGELAGIAQQVEQYLPQSHRVHGQCAEVLLGVNDEAVLVLASCPAVPMTSLISGASCTVCGLSSSFPASIFDRSSTWLMRPR